MNNPNASIFTKLSEIAGLTVVRNRSQVIESLPTASYYVITDIPSYSHGKQVSHQAYTVAVDLWTEAPDEASSLLTSIESKMIEINFRLLQSQEIADETELFHKVLTFTAII